MDKAVGQVMDMEQILNEVLRPTAPRILAALVVILLCCPFCIAAESEAPRFTAVFVDQQRVSGDTVIKWGHKDDQPELAGQKLADPSRPLRWLADNRLAVARPAGAFIEFVGGDCLPATLVGAVSTTPLSRALHVPSHWIVKPAVALKDSRNQVLGEIRVLPKFVRRVVWQRQESDVYLPGTLILRGGEMFSFRAARLKGDLARLLSEEGTRSVPLAEIAELHMPAADAWSLYWDELSELCNDVQDRIVQFELADGSSVTSSTSRLMIAPYSDRGNPDHWYHIIQPAWSLDAFAVRHRDVAVRRYFAPYEVPLSRLRPTHFKNDSLISRNWRWQVNRNIQGGMLCTADGRFGWGIGAHGATRLGFSLPPIATHFQTRFGLDKISAGGGCARASAQVVIENNDGSAATQPPVSYQSAVLVGAQPAVDSGALALPPASPTTTRQLLLAVDAMNAGHPTGSDPFDVRDEVDWLEPMVLLDQNGVNARLQERRAARIPAWHDWKIEGAAGTPFELTGRWDARAGHHANLRYDVRPTGAHLVLARELEITDRNKWLTLSVCRPTHQAHPSVLELHIDGALMAQQELPLRRTGEPEPPPLAFALDRFLGRRVRLELIIHPKEPGGAEAWVDLRAAGFAKQLPLVAEILEDNARLTGVADDGGGLGEASLTSDERHSGESCVRITPGGRFRIDLDRHLKITATPEWNEFRAIRFAYRKRGGGRFFIQFETDGEPLRFDLGAGAQQDERARQLHNANLPDQWMVMTQDLVAHFGPFTLKGISLGCVGGTEVLVDHIYVARQAADLDTFRVGRRWAATPLEAEKLDATGQQALARARAATVFVKSESHSCTGIVASPDGYVLTAGHLIGKPNEFVVVYFPDGQQANAQTLGIDRDRDLGLLKIVDEGTYPHVQMEGPSADPNQRYVAIAHPRGFRAGHQPLVFAPHITGSFQQHMLTTSFRPPLHSAGSPLLNVAGNLVGVQIRDGLDGYTYAPSHFYQASLERMKKGEVWGVWPNGSGPVLGLHVTAGEGAAQVAFVRPGTPAAAMDIQPGDVVRHLDGQPVADLAALDALLAQRDAGQEITLRVERPGKAQDLKIKLAYRR